MAFETTAILDDEEVQRFLAKLERKTQDMKAGSRQLAGILATTVYRDVMAHFDQQSGPEGTWVGWSEIYAEHMRKIGKSGNAILQDTGRLRNSFLPEKYRVVPEGVLFYNPAKTKDGFPYAAAHDEGGPKLPQRQFMWLSDIAESEALGMILQWMTEEGESL